MAWPRPTPSGRWQGIAKQGREIIGTKVFTRKADAEAWAQRVEEAASGGVSVKAGKLTVKATLQEWLEDRGDTVAETTFATDKELLNSLPTAMLKTSLAAVSSKDIMTWLKKVRNSRSYGTAKRRKESLNAFFAWCLEDKRIAENPAHQAKLPPRQDVDEEMDPFDEDEFEELLVAVREHSTYYADVIEVLVRTGLRWGEIRSIRVGDVRWKPVPAFRVRRSQPEGKSEKNTKGKLNRSVPLTDDVVRIVERQCAGKAPGDYLFTGSRGGQLWASTFKAGSHWKELSNGRRIHDLRHTAASHWLAHGLSVTIVQAWMGHANVSTTNRYLHHLGLGADKAALEILNSRPRP